MEPVRERRRRRRTVIVTSKTVTIPIGAKGRMFRFSQFSEPIHRCASTKIKMDESSPSREQRPAHRPPEPPTPAPELPGGAGAAFDNHAYQHDTPGEDAHAHQNDANHNVTASESFGVNGSANGTRPHDKEPYEAVNLELINLAPKNGQSGQNGQNGQAKDIPHKKDVEVDIPSNHYDEYFVPVNEHKKSLSMSVSATDDPLKCDETMKWWCKHIGSELILLVPVDENGAEIEGSHRGEKLYVMADKRGKGGCRKRLCWTLGVLLLLGAILIAVLAATGVFSNSNMATPVDQYNSSISSARAFGGISSGFEHTEHKHNDHDHSGHDHNHVGHDHDHVGHDHDHVEHDHDHVEHDHDHVEHDDGNAEKDHDNAKLDFDHTEDGLKEPTPEPIQKDSDTTTQTPVQTDIIDKQEYGADSQREHVHTTISDQSGISDHVTTNDDDDSLYVPRTVEGVLKIDNEQLQPEMLDETSSTFRQLSGTLTRALADALLDDQRVETDNHVAIEIISLRPGSLIVTYRIHWNPKTDKMNVPDPITPDILKSRLSNYLERNGRMLNVYHVSEDQLEARRVLDLCQDESNGCEYGCEFDNVLLDFKCTCPENKVPDMNNPKTCVHPLDNSLYQPIEQAKSDNKQEFKILNVSDESEHTRYVSPEEPITFDWMGGEISTSEPITERSSDIDHSHIFGIPMDKDKMHVQSNPESTPEPRPESSASTPEPEPKGEPVEQFADITTDSIDRKNTESYSETHLPEPTAEPISEPVAEQEPKFEINAQDKVATKHTMTPEPISKPATEQSVSIITEPFNTETVWSVSPTWMIETQSESVPKTISEEAKSRPEEPKSRPEVSESTPEISEPPPEPDSKSSVDLTSETETDAPITESQETTNETTIEAIEPKTDMIPELYSTEEVTTESNLQLKRKLETGIQQESNTEVTNKSEQMSDLKQAPHLRADEAIDDKVVALAESVYQRKDKEKTFNISTESKEISVEYNSTNQDISDSDTLHSSKELNATPERSDNSEYNSSKDSQREIEFSAAEKNQFGKEITERNTEELANNRNISRVEPDLEDVSSKEENMQRFDEGRNLKLATNKEVALSGTEDSASYINSDEATTISEDLVNNANTWNFNERGSSEFVFTLNDLKAITELPIQRNEQKNKELAEISSRSEENNFSSSNKIPVNLNNEMSTTTDIIDDVTKAFVATRPKSDVDSSFINVESSSDSDINVTSEITTVTESVIHEIGDNDTMEPSRTDADWLISGKDHEADTADSTTVVSTIDVNEHEQSMDSLDADYMINSSDKDKYEMPLYGIVTDYDTTNNRGKRIENSRPTENVTITTTEKILPTEKMIADYIYNNSRITGNTGQKEGQDKIETSKEEPAPVWEHTEIEPEKVFYNEEVANKFTTEIQTMSQSTTSPQTPLESTLSKDKSKLNVTVYEVPANYTKLSKGEYSGERKSELEEHDSEMNPFLPEIDNNKSLVKKLHEGQDIELSNINDTQNETSLEEIQSKEHKMFNASVDLSTESESSTSEENTQEGLKSLMKIENTNSDNNKNNSSTVNNNGTAVALMILTRNESFKPPVSSFLDDVSDLVPSKGWTTTEDTITQHLGSDNEMSVSTILRENPLDVNSATLRTVSSIHDVFEMELKTNAPTIDQSFSEETESNDPLSVISIKSAKKFDKKPANDFLQKKNEKSAKIQENNFNDISDDSENSRTLDYSHYNPSSNSEQQ